MFDGQPRRSVTLSATNRRAKSRSEYMIPGFWTGLESGRVAGVAALYIFDRQRQGRARRCAQCTWRPELDDEDHVEHHSKGTAGGATQNGTTVKFGIF